MWIQSASNQNISFDINQFPPFPTKLELSNPNLTSPELISEPKLPNSVIVLHLAWGMVALCV